MAVNRPLAENDIGIKCFKQFFHFSIFVFIQNCITINLAKKLRTCIQYSTGCFRFFGAQGSHFGIGFLGVAGLSTGNVKESNFMSCLTITSHGTAAAKFRVAGVTAEANNVQFFVAS